MLGLLWFDYSSKMLAVLTLRKKFLWVYSVLDAQCKQISIWKVYIGKVNRYIKKAFGWLLVTDLDEVAAPPPPPTNINNKLHVLSKLFAHAKSRVMCTGHHRLIFVFSHKHVVQGGLCQFIDHFNAVKFSCLHLIEQIQEASIVMLYIYDSPLYQPFTKSHSHAHRKKHNRAS